jgi:hypothetical protein
VGVSFAQSIPTPESVLGHKPGDDFYLANYDESRDYFRKLAAASNRIKLINVGKTRAGSIGSGDHQLADEPREARSS